MVGVAVTESFEGFKKAAGSFRVEHLDRQSRVGEHERVML
ncbi:MAG: hypothetical protein AVDCRST_MAG04-261 [uncultured Acetobacteraceae bacterium]|uniref:Uncharacterized protein n=1 Tax=uncultured Acetobacteraceae bacterium TaxID=169975 RepID=A0A6J4H548_9PROT|nr:MAG: hypothetical protein AVDCRST_MAG04-261 [uncultured Acetobacteraceae bacterium]